MDGATDPGERFDDPLGLWLILGRIRCELVNLGRCDDGLQIAIEASLVGLAEPSPSHPFCPLDANCGRWLRSGKQTFHRPIDRQVCSPVGGLAQ
jgi:hypothetical protein